jgi:two-component system response regulator PilR (NtrC family)
MGLEAERAMSVAEALALLKNGDFALCLTDMRLPDGEGLRLVEYISEHCPTLPVAVITAHGNMENAVAALKAGAFDYLSKPVSLEQLRVLVKSALNLESPTISGKGHDLWVSPPIKRSGNWSPLARSQAVYITGESGSGKAGG